ncbi:hypothetical protein K501DRAFT_167951 [Backusella circina FSU 941]|nr:hypothetical protein K501DRAFT_167951 [Backusella circina FSU 941]
MLLKQFQDCLVENRKRSRSLSVDSDLIIERPKPEKIARKIQGEDVFSKSSVKTWQKPRIKAWEDRHMNPEGYYFRFVVPGVGQQNGGWSNEEQRLFMARYNEWTSSGWKIGQSWGMFSKTIPRRVGYQCMNYYRKLLLEKKLKDDDYVVEGGKLKRNPTASNVSTSAMPSTDLGPEWETEDVKNIEKDVNQWLKEYHGRSGVTNLSKPINKTPKAPRIPKPTFRKSNHISDLVKKMPVRPKIPRLDGEEDDLEEMETEAEIAHLEHRDLETEWKERLAGYKEFIKPYSEVRVREKHWMLKQKWREGLSTTKM